MPETNPQPPTPGPERSQPPPDAPAPTANTPSSKGAPNGALFHTLLEAGFDAPVAYTAEKRIRAVVSEALTPQLEPFLLEMRQRFDAQDRKLEALTEAVAKLTDIVPAHGELLAEHDRKLDVIADRLDGLKAQVQILFGALALLITVLIAVFGFLFTT